jgi:hypothetical protein
MLVGGGEDRGPPQRFTLLPGIVALHSAIDIGISAGDCSIGATNTIVSLSEFLQWGGGEAACEGQQAQYG